LRFALTQIYVDDREVLVKIGNAVKTKYGDEGCFAWDEWGQGGGARAGGRKRVVLPADDMQPLAYHHSTSSAAQVGRTKMEMSVASQKARMLVGATVRPRYGVLIMSKPGPFQPTGTKKAPV